MFCEALAIRGLSVNYPNVSHTQKQILSPFLDLPFSSPIHPRPCGPFLPAVPGCPARDSPALPTRVPQPPGPAAPPALAAAGGAAGGAGGAACGCAAR